MGFNLAFSREADIELNTIDCFFGALGTVAKFQKDFNLQIARIINNPQLFQVRYRNVRIVHLENFNYSIHYTVEKNTIIVLRILSQSQSY